MCQREGWEGTASSVQLHWLAVGLGLLDPGACSGSLLRDLEAWGRVCAS